MTAGDGCHDGASTLDQYEARLADCEQTLRAAREQLDSFDDGEVEGGTRGGPSTRRVIAGGGLAALGLAGIGTAAGDPTGQVGTEDRPVEAVHAAAFAGPLTDGEELTSLVGDGLAIQDGELSVDGGI